MSRVIVWTAVLAVGFPCSVRVLAYAGADDTSASRPSVEQTMTTRLWKNSTGKFSVEAEYLGCADENVRLRCADGREIRVPVEKLSASDQEYLRKIQQADGTADRVDQPVSSEPTAKTSDPGKTTQGQRIVVLRVHAMGHLGQRMGMLQSAIADELARHWSTMGQEEIMRTLQERKDPRLAETLRLLTGSSKPATNERDELANLAAAFGARVIVRGTLHGDSKAATVRLSVWDFQQRKVVATVDLPADRNADLHPLVDAITRIWPPSTEANELAPGATASESTGETLPGGKPGSAGASPLQAGASHLLVLPFNLSGAARTPEEFRQLDPKRLQEAGRALEARIVKDFGNRWSIMRPEEVWSAVANVGDRGLKNTMLAALGRSRTKASEADLVKLAVTLGGRIVIRNEAQNTSRSIRFRISAWDSHQRREVATIECPMDQQADLAPLVTALNGVLPASSAPQVVVFSLAFNTDMGTADQGHGLSLAIRDALRKAGVNAVFSDGNPPTRSRSSHGFAGTPADPRGAQFIVAGAGVHRERVFHGSITRFDIKFQDTHTGRETIVDGGPFSAGEGERAAKSLMELIKQAGQNAPTNAAMWVNPDYRFDPPAFANPNQGSPIVLQGKTGPVPQPPRSEKTLPPAQVNLETQINSIGMPLVLIPAGEFVMGYAEGESDEKPAHRVQITRPFWLGRCEVTVGQFRKFVEDSNYDVDARRQNDLASQADDHPMVNVSWNDSKAFCDWLSKKETKKYRLPSEAEWEYACRAGTQTTWSFGNNEGDLGTYAWFAGNSARRPHAVGQKQPNPWGLYDMHGNVWEWCGDWYDGGYYASSPAEDPTGPKSKAHRIRRGGFFDDVARSTRSARRLSDLPDLRYSYLGFRVARVP